MNSNSTIIKIKETLDYLNSISLSEDKLTLIDARLNGGWDGEGTDLNVFTVLVVLINEEKELFKPLIKVSESYFNTDLKAVETVKEIVANKVLIELLLPYYNLNLRSDEK